MHIASMPFTPLASRSGIARSCPISFCVENLTLKKNTYIYIYTYTAIKVFVWWTCSLAMYIYCTIKFGWIWLVLVCLNSFFTNPPRVFLGLSRYQELALKVDHFELWTCGVWPPTPFRVDFTTLRKEHVLTYSYLFNANQILQWW